MTNKEVYKKTLTFSLRRLLWDFIAFLILGAFSAAGFILMDKINDKGLIGLAVGLLLGIIVLVIFLRFVSYTYKAGQIAMMTKAVTENELPENVLAEGKAAVKERFATVALFYAATRIIKGIFNQISRGLNSVGRAVGGDTGNTVTSVISTGIQVLVGYLCDCCLGWVFFRKEQGAARATCEGAVLFFKNWKTLLKNAGRIFGMGIASLIAVGGAFFGIFYGVFSLIPGVFERFAVELAEAAVRLDNTLPEFFTNPANLMLVAAAIAALIVWGIIHSTFIRPFILVGVLRNYMESGVKNIPTEESFSILDGKSAKFKKLREQGI